MDLKFIIAISEHRFLGYVFAPYFVQKDTPKGNYLIYDRVMLQNLNRYESILSPEEIQLVKIIEEYNDQSLLKIFSKKKISSREFISNIPSDLLEKQVRPFVERRLIKCVDILKYNPVPIYQKVMQTNIYESDKVTLVEEEARTVFNFKLTDTGLTYYLNIEHDEKELSLTGKEGLIVINDPCCLVLDDHMFIFRDIDGKKLLPFFEKEYISIPKQTEKKYFETFVKNTIKKYKVNAVGFGIHDEEAVPKPILSIENDFSGGLSIVLKFIYKKNVIFYANRKTDTRVSFESSDNSVNFYRLQRNFELENNYISQLLSFGLLNEGDAYFTPHQKVTENILKGYNLITWLNYNSSALKKAGFEIAQDKLDKNYYLDNIEIKFEVSDKENDWFDIMAVVELEGYKIPFVKFRESIISGNREFILPDERIVVLPEEWFESYKDILNFSKEKNDKLILDKQHFSLLNENIRGVSDKFKENMLTLLKTDSDINEEIPVGITATLRDYQKSGYTWMYRLYQNNFGGCLADDMGLGKTLQTLTLLKRVSEENKQKGNAETTTGVTQLDLFSRATVSSDNSSKTSLIIVPTSLVHNWINEILKFIPKLNAIAYIGQNREKLEKIYNKADLIITSYGILRNDLDQFTGKQFLYLILDESQMIKNPGSKTYQSIMQLKSDYRLVLTGTPIENSLTDLWSQMNFLNRGLLGSLSFFTNEFKTPIEKRQDIDKKKRLQQLIAPFILRRKKTEVEKELPDLTEQIIMCDMNDPQEAYYEKEKSRARNLVLEGIEKMGLNKSAMIILQSLTKLRQIANHPAMIDDNYLAGSGKYEDIKRHILNLHSEGHKVLVFSSFVKHLRLIENFLGEENIEYCLLTGETKNREKEIENFQNKDECQFFLVSLKAGGVGLNLTAADYVLILDPWWNPAAEMQAISRAHRIGQEKHVMVYRFIARQTLEEKILKLQMKKADLADTFINENIMKNLSTEEISELFS